MLYFNLILLLTHIPPGGSSKYSGIQQVLSILAGHSSTAGSQISVVVLCLASESLTLCRGSSIFSEGLKVPSLYISGTLSPWHAAPHVLTPSPSLDTALCLLNSLRCLCSACAPPVFAAVWEVATSGQKGMLIVGLPSFLSLSKNS